MAGRASGLNRMALSRIAQAEADARLSAIQRDVVIADLQGQLQRSADEIMLAKAELEMRDRNPVREELDPDVDAFYDLDRADPDEKADLSIDMVLAWDGNLAEIIDDAELVEIGHAVVREFEIDEAARSGWVTDAKVALEAASQSVKAKKNYPYPNASNVKYPLLTTSCIQFAARAYPAIVRGDEVIDAKPMGEDPQGEKAKRAARSVAFANDQLIYTCTEWEIGTDMLLHALPAIGAGFRKVYWDSTLRRPRLDYVSAIDVTMPIDAPSMELTPRITHRIEKYPYEIESLTRGENPAWLECEYVSDPSDTQARQCFLEQCRYIDLDKDGLSEPYVVTVHKDTSKVVRIDPAFDVQDVHVQRYREASDDGMGALRTSVVAIKRRLPWVDYTFLPDPKGGAYGMGFGQLLASLSDVIDTTINELIDAGHMANTNTGFLSSAVKTRSGDIEVKPNTFRTLPGAMNVKDAIYRMEFPGPSQTLFNMLEFLIATAKDITSVKDVLTGEAPGTQPATSTLALIEQGLQVFSAIYKRIYRSMTREFELLYELNARYLDDEVYNKFLDAQPPVGEVGQVASPMAGIGHNQGPPMGAADMGQPPASGMGGEVVPFPTPQGGQPPAALSSPPEAQPAPTDLSQVGQPAPGAQPPSLPGAISQQLQQQPQPPAPPPRPSARQDFNLEDLDIRPVSDPAAVTEMQRLAKANFLDQLRQTNPFINGVEATKRLLDAARMPEPEKLIVESNPLMDAQAQAQAAMAQAQAQAAQADAMLKQHQAKAAELEPQLRLQEMQLRVKEVEAKEAEVELKRGDAAIRMKEAENADRAFDLQLMQYDLDAERVDIERHKAAMDESERGMRLDLDADRNEIDRERNTLERLKSLDAKELSREQLMIELKRLVKDADEKKAARETAKAAADAERAQKAKDAAAERALKASEAEKDRLLETEKVKVTATLEAEKIKATRDAAKAKAAEKTAKEGEKKAAASSAQSSSASAQKATAEAIREMAEAVRRTSGPKRIVRDDAGKIIGAEPIEDAE